MNLEWMLNLPTEKGMISGYGPVYALTIEARPFVFTANGPCLIACEGTLPDTKEPPEALIGSFSHLLRLRGQVPKQTTLAHLREWAHLGWRGPFCDTCDGEGGARGGELDASGNAPWLACPDCSGKPFVKRFGYMLGSLFNMDLLEEALRHLDGGVITIGTEARFGGQALVVRSASPLWKVLLMNCKEGDVDQSTWPRYEVAA